MYTCDKLRKSYVLMFSDKTRSGKYQREQRRFLLPASFLCSAKSSFNPFRSALPQTEQHSYKIKALNVSTWHGACWERVSPVISAAKRSLSCPQMWNVCAECDICGCCVICERICFGLRWACSSFTLKRRQLLHSYLVFVFWLSVKLN